MSNILTIDWDFFFKASLKTRDSFPKIYDGALNSFPDNKLWLECPMKYVYVDRDRISLLKKALSNPHPVFTFSFLSENHGEVLNAVEFIRKYIGDNTTLTITNLDFHHDYSYNGGSTPRCDNWARILKEKEPDTEFKWCRHEDSVVTSFGEEVPVKECYFINVLRNISNGVYDYVHLCRSDLYSPPLADHKFKDILHEVNKQSRGMMRLDEIPDRSEVVSQYIDNWLHER